MNASPPPHFQQTASGPPLAPEAFEGRSLASLFLDRVRASGDSPALAVKQEGHYHWRSWNELQADVRRMAGRLRDAGLARGERLLLVSENRYEWILCDLAVHQLGAVHVAVHNSLSGEQIAEQLADSGARLAIVAGSEQAQKLAEVAAALPARVRFFSF
ncbi:MAG TPA: AMP-binding protein, partial [Pirellulales bacterium]|nr:AMP-binding protein [Pirellulales bacterium]